MHQCNLKSQSDVCKGAPHPNRGIRRPKSFGYLARRIADLFPGQADRPGLLVAAGLRPVRQADTSTEEVAAPPGVFETLWPIDSSDEVLGYGVVGSPGRVRSSQTSGGSSKSAPGRGRDEQPHRIRPQVMPRTPSSTPTSVRVEVAVRLGPRRGLSMWKQAATPALGLNPMTCQSPHRPQTPSNLLGFRGSGWDQSSGASHPWHRNEARDEASRRGYVEADAAGVFGAPMARAILGASERSTRVG